MTIQQRLDATVEALKKLVGISAKSANIPEAEAAEALKNPEAMTAFLAKIESPKPKAEEKKDGKAEDEKKDGKAEDEKKDGEEKKEEKKEGKAEDEKKDGDDKEEKKDENAFAAALAKMRAELTAEFDQKLKAAVEVAGSKQAVQIAAAAGITPPAKADVAGTAGSTSKNTTLTGAARAAAYWREHGLTPAAPQN